MGERLRQEVRRRVPQTVAWRRRLHQHPELGFEETATAAFVAGQLRSTGLEVRTGIAETGVVGILRSTAPREPAVLLRADMDALPIQEVAGREYGSQIPGRMHACGHDGHTSMLLAAADVLAEMRDRLAHDVVFCFQPGEEGMGGAEKMIEQGVLELVEVGKVYGLHLWSQNPVGTVLLRPGPMMAATDEFAARIVGRGGHGAQPQATRDPVVAAALAVTALQTVVARAVDPVETAVVSVGSLHAGSAANVIPDEARLLGTLRSFSEEVRQLLRERLREVLQHAAAGAGCRSELELKPGYPAVVNDPRAVDVVRRVAGEVVGSSNVVECPPMAAAEDFAYFLQARPGAFAFVGAGNAAAGITAPHHSPAFDIDESALGYGVELLVRLALESDAA